MIKYTTTALCALIIFNSKIQASATECYNNPDYFYQFDPDKTCKWIRVNQRRRETYCAYVEVHEHCPQTCGVCCINDPDFKFNTPSGEKDCAWIKKKKSERKEWCTTFEGDIKIQERCQKVCDFCYDYVQYTTSVPSASPTGTPSVSPSDLPSHSPSALPSVIPSASPSLTPTVKPSGTPSHTPSTTPSEVPTVLPSTTPTDRPTNQPSSIPSTTPSSLPSVKPSELPSSLPSTSPSLQPSTHPSMKPTQSPTVSSMPTGTPSITPSNTPTVEPSSAPSGSPSTHPSSVPTSTPSTTPTSNPSGTPSGAPTKVHSRVPTSFPSKVPSANPSGVPSSSPSDHPSTSQMPSSDACVNDPTYYHKSDKKKTCDWMRSNESRRQKYCTSVERHERCPQTCGVCCVDDADYTFTVDGKLRDCSWIAKKKERQKWCTSLDNDVMVQERCLVACDFCQEYVKYETSTPSALPSTSPSVKPSQSPSDYPSASPSTHPSALPSATPSYTHSPSSSHIPSNFPFKCVNDHTYFRKSDPKKTCLWIRSNDNRRKTNCRSVEVHKHCPQSCGVCCEDDTSFQFKVNGSKKDCAWIAKKKNERQKWCTEYKGGVKVRESCQVACDACKDYIQYKTLNPSASPSVSPSGKPSVMPSDQPSTQPSASPSVIPTARPSYAPTQSPTQDKPNIMLIMADDVGTGDIPLYWNSGLVDMPNIQKLANMGVTFKDAHSTPLCAPSRYMLLSGNYQHRGIRPAGTWNLWGETNQFRWYQKSIAETLQEGGNYATSMSGKWHLGGKIPLVEGGVLSKTKLLKNKNHDWSQPLIDGPQDIGFGSSYITTAGVQASPYAYFRDGFLTTSRRDTITWGIGNYTMPHGMSSIIKEGEGDREWDSSAYNMVIVNETARFIDDHMESEQANNPWFVYAALGAVHPPFSPPNNYLDGSKVSGRYSSLHLDMLLEMDKSVGSLVKLVEERGLANNTIIIFTSDNGGIRDEVSHARAYGHNSHGPLRGKKGDIYEGGHRVPMIFRYDGKFPINQTRRHMVGLNDIYRTLCELINIPVPETSAQDSVSFADYIFSDENVSGLRKNLSTWAYKDGTESQAIRFGDMKYIKHTGTTSSTELYDLSNDLGETNNLVNNQEHRGLVKDMKKKLTLEGPCPKDATGKFKLTSGPGKGKKKTCDFFKNHKRCNDGINLDGEIRCSSLCGRHSDFCKKKFVS